MRTILTQEESLCLVEIPTDLSGENSSQKDLLGPSEFCIVPWCSSHETNITYNLQTVSEPS